MEAPNTRIRFDEFELDLSRGELSRGKATVELQPKPLGLLVHLAVNRDRVVSKDELLDEIWPDVIVSEAALSSALKDLRRCLGDDGNKQGFIRTFRRRGYRFVADVIEVESAGAYPSSEPSHPLAILADRAPRLSEDSSSGNAAGRTPMVGRAKALDRIRAELNQARRGEPRVLLIQGEAGVGKSRLVDEVIREESDGFEIAQGRGRADTQRPYVAFVEALSSWLEGGDATLTELIGDEARIVRRLLQPTAAELSPSAPRAAMVGERQRLELFSAVSRAMIGLARRRPTILVLDDMHWSDPSGLDLLSHLAVQLGEVDPADASPLLIIATLRVDGLQGAAAATFERLRSERCCSAIDLEGVDEFAIRELVESLGVERPSNEWIAEVAQLSGGNPLFVQQLARHFQDHVGADVELPDTLASAMRARLDRLSADCRNLLALASIIGDRFGLMALASVTGRPEAEVGALLAEARGEGIVSGTRRTFRFEHPTWRRLLRDSIADDERRRTHAAIADVLEDLYATADGEHAIEIADHLVAAGGDLDGDRLFHHARLAGDQAFAVYAWRSAGRFYAEAAEAGTSLAAADRAALHFRAAVAYNHDWNPEACVRHYDLAADGFRSGGDKTGLTWTLMYLARARFTLASTSYGSTVDVTELDGLVSELGSDDQALQALALETLSEAAWMEADSARARELAERSLVIGHNLDDHEVSHHACMGLSLACLQELEAGKALEHWRDALAHAGRIQDLWLASAASTRIAMAMIHLGRFDDAERKARDATETARLAQNVGELSFVAGQITGLHAARGDFDRALAAAHDAMGMLDRSRYPWGGPFALLGMASALQLRGERERALGCFDQLAEPGVVFDEPGPPMQLLATVGRLWLEATLVPAPRIDLKLLGNLVALTNAAGSDIYALGPICILADVACRQERADLVGSLVPMLELAVDRGIRFSTGWVISIERVLGTIASASGDVERAAEFLEAARDTCSAAGANPELVRAHLELSRLAARRRDVDPRAAADAARAHHDAAVELAKKIDANTLRLECDRVGAQLNKDRRGQSR